MIHILLGLRINPSHSLFVSKLALGFFEAPLFFLLLGFGLILLFLLDPGILLVKIRVLPPVGGATQFLILENVDPRNLDILSVQLNVKMLYVLN